MSSKLSAHQAIAFEFIYGLDSIKTVDDIMNAITVALGQFGFEHLILAGLPSIMQRVEPLVVMRRWPPGWFEHYTKNDYIRFDPVVHWCRNNNEVFDWGEVEINPRSANRALEVMNRAHDFGMSKGWSVPIHAMGGYQACFSMAGAKIDIASSLKPAVHMMALYAFERSRVLAPSKSAQTMPWLSSRECEVLIWSAHGRSAAEVADIIGTSTRTVTAHLVSASAKLGANNKTQAVAKAIHHRLIQI